MSLLCTAGHKLRDTAVEGEAEGANSSHQIHVLAGLVPRAMTGKEGNTATFITCLPTD